MSTNPKRVLVTGGADGIGLAIARAFASDGDVVHIGDADEQAVDAAVNRHGFTGSVCDITSREAADHLFDDVSTLLGGLDVLVNNAGVSGPTAPTDEVDPAAWEAVVAVNLTGTFNVTRRAIPHLRQSGQGRIIMLTSLAGRFGYPNRSTYSTTKWGLVGFTKTLSRELGSDGITANAVAPGAVQGPRMQRVLEGRAEVSGRSVEDETELALGNQSVQHFVDPDDIAALTLHLSGPRASSVSGQIFPIDGDSQTAS